MIGSTNKKFCYDMFEMTLISCYKVDFKSHLTLQNQLVGLYKLIYCKFTLSLVNMRSSVKKVNHYKKTMLFSLVKINIKFFQFYHSRININKYKIVRIVSRRFLFDMIQSAHE